MTNISSKQLHDLLQPGLPEGSVVVDVREPYELADGKIAGAINLPINSLMLDHSGLGNYANIYLYCLSGSRSFVAAHLLAQAGVKNVFNLQDGFIGWMRNGFPIEK